MRALSSALLLAVSATALPAAHAAEWTRVGRGANPEVYVDLASIKEENNGRSAWVMRNFRKEQTAPDGKPYRSMRVQHLYACQDHTATLQAQAFYPDAMGKGEAIGNFKYEQYDAEKIAAGSAMDSVSRRVCRKKLRKVRR
ncbi:surface-adhesin E family protein [Pseudoduganella rivuli]|uniref:surface-adhesin E family protein n=1 Tax=Pseudoduganella rivuli TaxID=2666085 RepID=UPI0018A21639|nr:surface-adhesin E family protein [Pseudoduganella rivuli]